MAYTNFSSLADFRAFLELRLSQINTTLDQFRTDFIENPERALEWSATKGVFEAAVRKGEYEHLIESFEKRDPEDNRTDAEVLAFLTEYYTDRAQTASLRLSNSGSVTANRIEDSKRLVLNEIAAVLSGRQMVSML